MAGMVGLVGQCGKERFYEEFGIASETYTDVYACLSLKMEARSPWKTERI